MKVRITQLKAPWPEGVRVGDTHEFSGPMPAWAIGKCVLAGEPAKAEPSADEMAQRVDDLMRHHSAAVSALQQDLADVRAELDAEKAKGADLAGKLADAEAALAAAPKVESKADHKPKKGG